MRIRLAVADFTFPLLDHDRVLDLAALLEFDGVDIGLFEGRSHLWPSREFKNATASGRRLGRNLADRGLKPADVFLQVCPKFSPYAINHPQSSRRKRGREWFLRTLDYVNACGARHVTALPGVYFHDEPKAASWNRACEQLAWRVDQAEQQGLTFSIEAHLGSIVPTPLVAQRLVESVKGLTLTLDYTHFTRNGLPDSEVEPLVRYATHFHCRGARKGRLQTSFKNNTIDYARVLKVLNAAGYRGYIGIEYVWIDWEHCNETDNLSETIQFRRLFRSI